MKKIVVLYHKHCPDGFGAAWAAWKKLGRRATYIGIDHRYSPLNLEDKTVYFLDIAYPPQIIQKILKNGNEIFLIDHHISNKTVVGMFRGGLYDLKHSGCVLAWYYFHPDKAVPELLLNIEDLDLWKFKLFHTKELMAFIDLYDYDFKIWNKLVRQWQKPASKKGLVRLGEIILKYEQKILDDLETYAEKVKFCGYNALAVNTPILNSQICQRLNKKLPPISLSWFRNGKSLVVSLRSNGKVDVSKLAAKFGGGGHKKAAGFTWTKKGFPWTPLKN